MQGQALWILSVIVLAAAVPQPARYDQRQSGTYNLHISIKDGQVFSVVKDVLVSAPVRNFGVTLKGPIPTQASRTESPRTGLEIAKNAAPSTSTEIPSASTTNVPKAAVVNESNSTNSRRQNNKLASQTTTKHSTDNIAPPPPPVDTPKSRPSGFPPLPPSIIAALTENRPINQHNDWPSAQLNEITWNN